MNKRKRPGTPNKDYGLTARQVRRILTDPGQIGRYPSHLLKPVDRWSVRHKRQSGTGRGWCSGSCSW
jgi:hypothetical protein